MVSISSVTQYMSFISNEKIIKRLNKKGDDFMEKLLNIQIKDNYKFNEQLLDMKLTELYCKHMKKNNSDEKSKSNKLLNASHNIGYEWCEWGSHENFPSNLSHHIDIITKMERNEYNHAIRIVICKYDFSDDLIVWTDNLHSTIKYIRELGKDVCLKDVPFYVVDLIDSRNPKVLSDNEILRPIVSDILGAVSNAYFRYEMSNSSELINIRYLVSDVLNDNPELYTYHNTRLGVKR